MLPALNYVSPVPAETLVQMAWQFLYVLCLPEICGLQGNRFTPECWGLRNPPGGVMFSWAGSELEPGCAPHAP